MNYEAYWISPEGEIIPVPDHHIDLVIAEPERFGLSVKAVVGSYSKHKEKLHVEGFARNDTMFNLIKKRWIRIRYKDRSDSFTIQTAVLDDVIREYLMSWATGVIKESSKSNYTGYVLGTKDATESGILEELAQYKKKG